MAQIFTTPNGINYACGASLVVESTWNSLLMSAAGPESILIMLDSNNTLGVISSSNRPVSYSDQLAHTVSTETLTASIRQAVIDEYGSLYADVSAQVGAHSFQRDVEGQSWIIMIGEVELTQYEEDKVLIVIATPRKKVFAQIDAVRSRSVAIAVGLSVGISLLMAILFGLIVIPLRHLAKAMIMLTQMDFAALDSGKLLDEQSHITEIRAVQYSFSTMVKAFAGGIKKNRQFIAPTYSKHTVALGTTTSM
ncbi:hypothetical protein HKX48_003175, partial [Thoreauomyces humboldtii]